MPLHDAVGINCKKGATTEYQEADVKYMGKGVYVDDYVCVILLDMTTPPWWREKVMVYYYYYYSNYQKLQHQKKCLKNGA